MQATNLPDLDDEILGVVYKLEQEGQDVVPPCAPYHTRYERTNCTAAENRCHT